MTLFPNNCTAKCFFILIVELKSKLLYAQVLLFCIFLKSEKHYFYISPETFFGHLFLMKAELC